jgi:hypothetical protein
MMSGYRTLWVAFFIAIISPATFATSTSEVEFERRALQMRERFLDFNKHLQEREEFDAKRRRGAAALRERRAKEDAARERARIEFIRNRPRQKRISPLEYERQLLARQKREVENRRRFVEQRQRLERLEKTVKHVPLEKELAIE